MGPLFSWFRRQTFLLPDFAQKWHTVVKTNSINCANFITLNTFLKWFFPGYLCSKTDFRKHVDPWCEHTPKVLACDGTDIGVSARNLNLIKPVTGVDDIDHTSITQNKHYDCVFVANKDARLELPLQEDY